MNCHDAREGFSALRRSGMGLTELALLEVHVRQCVECQKEERASVQEMLNSRQRVIPTRALLHCLSKVIDAIHFGTTSIAGWLIRFRVLASIFLTVARPASVKVIEASRVGVTWLVGLFTRVRRLLPTLFRRSARGAASVIEAIAFTITCGADLLARLRWSLTVTVPMAARAAIEAARAGVTRILAVLVLLRCLLPGILTLYQRAAANVVGAARVASVCYADLLARLRVLLAVSLTVALQTTRRVIAASRVGPTGVLSPLTRVRRLQTLLIALSERAVKTIEATRVAGRIGLSTSGCVLSLSWHKVAAAWSSTRSTEPVTRSDLTFGTRSLLRVCAGIGSLAILVATVMFLWPREGPADLMPRPSTGERFSASIRPPAYPEAVEPPPAVQLAEIQTPKAVLAPQAAAAPLSPPDTRRAAMRPGPSPAPDEIIASVQSPDPTLAGPPAIDLTSIPSAEATWSREPTLPQASVRTPDRARSENVDASDLPAAIEPLLKGKRAASRRHIESP